jgi:hypothetical protein
MASFTNLFIGYNRTEKFRILIVADGEEEALEIATDYAKDADFNEPEDWCILEAEKIDNLRFDCDYVIYRQ